MVWNRHLLTLLQTAATTSASANNSQNNSKISTKVPCVDGRESYALLATIGECQSWYEQLAPSRSFSPAVYEAHQDRSRYWREGQEQDGESRAHEKCDLWILRGAMDTPAGSCEVVKRDKLVFIEESRRVRAGVLADARETGIGVGSMIPIRTTRL